MTSHSDFERLAYIQISILLLIGLAYFQILILLGYNLQIQRENPHTKTASTQLYSSQIRPSAQKTKASAEANSRTELIEILRRSSLQSSRCNENRVVSHTESVLATFKLEKLMKKEPNMSIRTL